MTIAEEQIDRLMLLAQQSVNSSTALELRVAALEALSYVNYVDRGDPSAWDKEIGAFTADSAWHANGLDLSSVIPSGATLALFLIGANDGNAGNIFQIREGGNSNAFNIGVVRTILSGVTEYKQAWVPVTAARTFDYYITSGTDYVYLCVLGWLI